MAKLKARSWLGLNTVILLLKNRGTGSVPSSYNKAELRAPPQLGLMNIKLELPAHG